MQKEGLPITEAKGKKTLAAREGLLHFLDTEGLFSDLLRVEPFLFVLKGCTDFRGLT
jgi:hypothetical protein